MIDMHEGWQKSIVWALRVNFIFLVIDLGLLLTWLLLYNINILAPPVRRDFLSLLLLLESGLVLLIGGSIAMSSSIFVSKIREHIFHSEEKWSKEKQKRSEVRANLYILAGIFLFLESVGFALFV
jgi:hypothetical protein